MENEQHRHKGCMSRANRSVTVTMESVLALAVVIGPEVDKQITWLQSKGLQGRNMACPACNQLMDLQQRKDITDQYRWRCPNTTCKKSVSIRSGTFFEKLCPQLQQDVLVGP